MSLFIRVLAASLLSFSAFAVEIDPKVLEVMRKEQSQLQSFCFSFAHDGVRNGMTVSQDCLAFASARYWGNYGVASKARDLVSTGEAVARAHGEFCASLGDYSRPGNWVRGDCEAWNRQRADLYSLGNAGTASSAALTSAIDKLESTRRRFCQSLLQGGNAGDAQVFGSRINNCFSVARLSSLTDRAILLGAF